MSRWTTYSPVPSCFDNLKQRELSLPEHAEPEREWSGAFNPWQNTETARLINVQQMLLLKYVHEKSNVHDIPAPEVVQNYGRYINEIDHSDTCFMQQVMKLKALPVLVPDWYDHQQCPNPDESNPQCLSRTGRLHGYPDVQWIRSWCSLNSLPWFSGIVRIFDRALCVG